MRKPEPDSRQTERGAQNPFGAKPTACSGMTDLNLTCSVSVKINGTQNYNLNGNAFSHKKNISLL